MEKLEFKYNYIVCGSTTQYFEYMYKDLMSLDNVCYLLNRWKGSDRSLAFYIHRLLFTSKVNKFDKIPFSKYMYNRIYQPTKKFEDNKPLCFLFFENSTYLLRTSYIKFLRQKYPNSKFVLFMQDLVSKNPNFNLNKTQKSMDCIYSYDLNDCKKYGFIYHPTPLSYVKIENNDVPFCDVYFCGLIKSKERYDKIIAIYKQCISKGLKCLFFMVGAPKNDRLVGDGLIYDRKISYATNLKYVSHSKCILEIMQDNAVGYTLRLWESILYDKHLLSNNIQLKESPFYSVDKIHLIPNSLVDIKNWINIDIRNSKEVKAQLSPINLLRFIEHNF